MYLHIGGGYSVPVVWICGIFDLDRATEEGSTTLDFLVEAQSMGQVRTIGHDLPRSFLLLVDGTIYLSPISTYTLRERLRRGGDNALLMEDYED